MNAYVKSPLNYVGGKYKLLPQIIPLFPDKINTFVDLFGGGFNVGVNVNASQVIYNDVNDKVTEILQTFKQYNIEELLCNIDFWIHTLKLSKINESGYKVLRNFYNNSKKDPIVLYTLICYSFNNQIRFNSKGEFNMPFGKDRSSFNPKLRQRFIEFVNRIHEIDCVFQSKNFTALDLVLESDDFVYCDPPYLNSTATYNENGGWTESEESKLLEMLDKLNDRNIKWALSNNLKYDNPILNEWKDKYNIHYLNGDYSNCNYQKKDKSSDIEVLITNY